jgi:hypothetical protein
MEAPAVVVPPVFVHGDLPRVRPKRSLFRRILGPFIILVGLLTVTAGGGAGAWLLFTPATSVGDPGTAAPPHVRRVSITVTPPQAQCPRASMHVSATIIADGGPGQVELRWRLPDGSATDHDTFSVDGGRTILRAAIDLTLTGSDRLRGKVVAVVGPNGARASAPIRYLCPSAPTKKHPDRSRAM